jgi:hypothetical protein
MHGTAGVDDISKAIAEVTTWDVEMIKILLETKHFDLVNARNFADEIALCKMEKAMSLALRIGIKDLSLLLSWTNLKLDFSPTWKLAKSIRRTIRGKYAATDYEKAIKPSHDQLRHHQRDALITYLLVQEPIKAWGVTDADGLFEFFLIDVQMGSCMQTSRTKQAISSVQLFVQRCFLGLEKSATMLNTLDEERWKWMSKQTIWAANRKVFLWPENWLVPSLRDKKTPIYSEMESAMLQKDVKPENVLESFRGFITGVAQVARMRAVALYVELARNGTDYFLHCVSMTVTSPYLFFHRTYNSADHEWTPWVRITVDIPTYTIEWIENRTPPNPDEPRIAREEDANDDKVMIENQPNRVHTGCYVVPMGWKSRCLLFVGEIAKKTISNDEALDRPFGDFVNGEDNVTARGTAPYEAWEIKLGWSEYRAGKWTQKQVASETFMTKDSSDPELPADSGSRELPIPKSDGFQFLPYVDKANDIVRIEVWYHVSISRGSYFFYAGSYIFNGTSLKQSREPKAERPFGLHPTSFQIFNGLEADYAVQSLQIDYLDGEMSFPYFGRNNLAKPDDDFKTPYIGYQFDPNGVVTYMDGKTRDLFYHPFPDQLVTKASGTTEDTGIQPIEDLYRSLEWYYVPPTFGIGIDELPENPSSSIGSKWTGTFKELSKPYSHYNWELGFHAPTQVAEALMKSQQFDDALEMMQQVFNPSSRGNDIRKVWKWYPFQHSDSDRVLEGILNQLNPRQPDDRITKWREAPFQPFAVARDRIVAYMKWTVMLYIKTLVAYGDMYFRRRTLEDIPLAIQLYVLASHMYGPKGETIPKQGKKIPQTYSSLLDKWDAFSNATVQLEIAFPYSNQTPAPWHVLGTKTHNEHDGHNENDGSGRWAQQIGLANIFGFATSRYFCLPSNPELQSLRATIDQRLYNIRNCLDIDGRPMPLALWEPPIEPGDLVAALASGLSLSSALNDLNATLPNYRFTWLLARALEANGELKNLESTFLSIKEKRDGEALQLLRTGHDITMQKMMMELKKTQLEESVKNLIALRASQESSKHRFDFYSRLAGVEVKVLGSGGEPFKPKSIDIDVPSSGSDAHLNLIEIKSESLAAVAQTWTDSAANLEVMANLLHMLPSINLHAQLWGCGPEVVWSTANFASGMQANAREQQLYASSANFTSSQASRKANYIKQYQDRLHQMNLAGLEFEHINTQIDAQQTRIRMANLDIASQQRLIDNAVEVSDFLKNKYTNDELYAYLEGTTRTSMYQTYLLAYDLAKKAELAFRFERRPTAAQRGTDFVSFGYFNPARDGLQASQQLYVALKRMDAAYQEERGHDYELAKSVSLRQLNPFALLMLRETGSCTLDVPEVAFDMDFPGHYFRRLKTVSLTVPCVVGPHVGVNATLRLLKHRHRADALATSGRDYVEDTSSGTLDPRFRTAFVPIDAVATSSGQNDTGVFELSIKDERYLPFEGAGAISTWQITLPLSAFRPFDYGSIADVVLTMKYTACEGGARLRKAASESVVEWMSSVEDKSQDVGLLALWDVRAEFAAEWAKLSGPRDSTAPASTEDIRTLVLGGLFSRLPSFVAGRDPDKVRATDVTLATNLPIEDLADLAINFKHGAGVGSSGDENTPFDSGPLKSGSLRMFRISDADERIGEWALMVGMKGIKVEAASRMWLVVRFKLPKPT